MSNTVNAVNNDKQGRAEKGSVLRKKIIPLLTLLLVIAITIGLLLNRDKLAELGNYGYLGAFLISLAFNATIILPLPSVLLLLALGAAFNPVLVGLVSAAGGTLGETTGYVLGYSGRQVARGDKRYMRVEGWMKRWGAWAIFVFAVIPVPLLDIAGIVAGALRFPVWKFLLACWAGKSIKYVGLALAGAWGWETVLRFFS